MLVRYVAHDFFEQVLERDDALDTAVIVNDETEVELLFLHLPKHILEPGSIDDVIGFVNYIGELE